MLATPLWLGWLIENPLTFVYYLAAIAGALGTAANALSHFPRAQGFVFAVASALGALVKFLTDLFSLIANAKGRGLAGPFTLPFVPTLAKKEEQAPPQGQASLYVLLGIVAIFVAGKFALHGLYAVAVGWLVLFAVLLVLSFRLGGRLALALAFVITNSGCGHFTAERREALKQDLVACGIQLGLAEFHTADEQAQAILADRSISDLEAHAALDALASTMKAGLLRCIAQLTVDAFKPMAEASKPSALALLLDSPNVFESPEVRAHRRASRWLERK